MPSMPTMPEMPEMPAIGSSPYRPEMPKFVSPFTNQSNQKKTTNNQNGKAADSTATLSAAEPTSQDLINSLFSGAGNLTASDITSLYNSGMFNDLSSLTGSNFANSASSEALLKQVLNTLNELKAEKNNATAQEQRYYSDQNKDSENFRKRDPSIIRFKINGYNINDSLTTVFFSEPEPDGSFLLTADRRYFTGSRPRTETFYLLFKSEKSNGSSTTYNVIPSIIQDSANPNSFIYRLTQIQGLKAEKTGNLVVFTYSKNDFVMDMLLNIDNRAR